MSRPVFLHAPIAGLIMLALSGCSIISSDRTSDSLRANANRIKILPLAHSPAHACPRIARMLSWCANGPNYHYRCIIAPDNSRAELTGTFEAIFQSEVFLVSEFVRQEGGSLVTIYQRDDWLVPDFVPLIEAQPTASDCRVG